MQNHCRFPLTICIYFGIIDADQKKREAKDETV